LATPCIPHAGERSRHSHLNRSTFLGTSPSFSRDWHNLFSGATTLQSILAYASASIFQTKILARSPIRENASRWKSRAFVTPANSVSISSNGSC
jgi:hypothetical protein